MRPIVIATLLGGAALALPQKGDTPSRAQDGQAAEEPVYDPGPDVTPPRVIHQVSPSVPPGEQGFRIAGTVAIGLVVSSRGEPKAVHVVRSLDKDLDRSSVEAVQQWRFEPGRKAGAPVAVRVTIEIRFHDM